MNAQQTNIKLNKESARIAVVGAGPAGLVCARQLAKRGWKNVTVLEASDRAGGKTHSLTLDNPNSENGSGKTVIELGTQTITYGAAINELLADTGIQQVLQNAPLGKARNPPDQKNYYPPLAPIAESVSFPKKVMETARFMQALNQQTFLDSPGFRGLPGKNLSMSIDEWYEHNNFVYSKYFTMPFISTGLCGVDYDRVPVAYMMKLYKVMLRLPLWRSITFVMRKVAPGNDLIWQRVASELNVRYRQAVSEVKINGSEIYIRNNAGENLTFDRMIWTGRLPQLGKVLCESGNAPVSSRTHYGKVKYLRRAVFTYRIEGLERNYVWVHSDNIMRRMYGSPLITLNVKGSDWYTFYPWMSAGQTLDEVDRCIREFVSRLGARVISLVTDPMAWDYNPYFESEMLERGVFDQIENEQGKDGLYVCGETMSGISLAAVADYAKDLIERHF